MLCSLASTNTNRVIGGILFVYLCIQNGVLSALKRTNKIEIVFYIILTKPKVL